MRKARASTRTGSPLLIAKNRAFPHRSSRIDASRHSRDLGGRKSRRSERTLRDRTKVSETKVQDTLPAIASRTSDTLVNDTREKCGGKYHADESVVTRPVTGVSLRVLRKIFAAYATGTTRPSAR